MAITNEYLRYTYRDGKGQMLGFLQIEPTGEIAEVYVKPDHRRKGIATALYAHVRDLHPGIRHSPERTIDGQMWALSVGGVLPPWIGV